MQRYIVIAQVHCNSNHLRITRSKAKQSKANSRSFSPDSVLCNVGNAVKYFNQ